MTSTPQPDMPPNIISPRTPRNAPPARPFALFSRIALKALNGTGIALFISMVALVLAQVVARKFFEPLVWSEELARYVFIWVAFVGWIIATHNRSHIHISLVTDRAGPRLRLALALFANLCVTVFALILAVKGAKLVDNNLDIETVTLFFNFWLVYAVIPATALATLAALAADSIRRVHEYRTERGGAP